jgi:DNA-binding XRE family transcriptional regulator
MNGSAGLFFIPAGEDMVVVPRRDYERLVEAAENLADVAAYDRAKALLASGSEERVPAAVVDAILAGENPIRVWRRHRGLTLEGLSAATSTSRGYLSQIESGKRQGGIETLKLIAKALDLTVDDII